MLDRLRALLRRPNAPNALRVALEAQERRLAALEQLQAARELDYAEMTDRVARNLKRVQVANARAEQREPSDDDAGGRPSVRSILSAKYGGK